MGWKSVTCVGLLALLTGCNLAYYAGHNLANEAVSRADEHKLQGRLQAEAKACWKEVCRQYPARTFSPEFADGFLDGYADYLDHGGEPKPPAMPPLKYRRTKYLTPEGHARVRDYFCGFKYGADVAAATGHRQFLVVPILLPEARPEPPLNIVRLPAPPDPDAPDPVPASDPKAPAPQPLTPPAAPAPTTPPARPTESPAPPPATVPEVTTPPVPTKPDPQPLTPPVPVRPADPLPPASPPAPKINAVPPAGPGTGLPAIDLPFTDPTSILKPSGGIGGGGVIPAAVPAPLPAVELPPPPAEPPPPVPAVSVPPPPVPAAAPPTVEVPPAPPAGS
jgi:hypothetical protein